MKRRSVINFLTLSTVLSVALAAGAPAQAAALDDILKNKVLKVAVPQDFPPFGSVGPDMKPAGYDIDVAKLVAKELGVAVELVPVTSANRIPYLNTKKVDLVISSLGKNPEREKVIDFTIAYAPFFSGVFGSDKVAVGKGEELAGKTVGVTRGAVEDLELTKLAPSSATIKRFEDNNATISAFLSGQVPLIATGNVVAGAISEKQTAHKLDFKFIIKNSPCHIGINKGEPQLLERVNHIIEKAKQDGSLNGIAEKWLKLKRPVASFL
ncbi:transporter substrate-binding domain-containing protein [Duganella sp. FT92W]|uniref:Transporter substrate-binding domain-containing protein n=1 Tax=Pseudoduganella rivuli TaxID=2666085 RepID=A0A7X2LVE3_9BURK|nr:transporter substrate-binding domain-containing protein [Pseudoduganella rivuli]MRV76650.1 transporter substrate-binding domain-containing protein [Pseudoduganella rivuli]